ncbi:MAG: DUF418 domain-containing protein, partial [Gemmatimonadales bacterium]
MTVEETPKAEPLAPRARATSWGPAPTHQRIVTLDALRGLAILGMLLVNIFFFAFPPAARDILGGEAAAGDRAVALLIALFAEGKFYTLFSILFGMGLALQSRRAWEAGRSFTPVYVRRLGVLFFIGLAHGLLFSTADILALYAVIGLIALSLRELRPKRLLIVAGVVYAAGVLLLGVWATRSPGGALPSEPDWKALVAYPESPSAQASARVLDLTLVPLITRGSPGGERELYAFMADEERIFKHGAWRERLRHRFVSYLLVGMPIRLLFVSWRVLPLFLLGVYFVKRGIFVESNGELDRYKTMLFSGLVAGLSLELAGGAARAAGGDSVLALFGFLIGTFAGVPLLSLAYAGGVALVCVRRGGSAIVRSFAAVGRTALT